MQLEEDPSISQVANRFMGTGLLSAPLPGKLKRPLRSAMVRAAGGTVRHRAAAAAAAAEGRCQLRHTGGTDVDQFSDSRLFGSRARELTVVVPCERWGTSSCLPPSPSLHPSRSASQAEELQWGAAQRRGEERSGARVLGLLCTTTTLLRLYEQRLVPHAQARRGAGRRQQASGGRPVERGQGRFRQVEVDAARGTRHFFFLR